MTLPLLTYPPSSRNHRVNGFEVPGEESAGAPSVDSRLDPGDIDRVISAAYRQIFNEQQLLSFNRQTELESQLRNGQISVREFIQGLATSPVFRERNYDCSNNYRFARLCVQRILGREVYGQREELAWSIVLATKGLQGFINDLVNSDEYEENFGDSVVPFQRRRILPQRSEGELPIARMPRYGADYRQKLEALGYFSNGKSQFTYRWAWQKPPYSPVVQAVGKVITLGGAAFVAGLFIASALGAFGLIQI
ncbi:MAG: phycobilisome rod-core linker polypeptide [Cyanobacteria bacterium P01_H01_bin.130]